MVILVRYGEIHLKGLNRPYFERLLIHAIKGTIKRFGATVERGDGRYFVRGMADADIPDVMSALTKVFGIHSISLADEVEKNEETVFAAVAKQVDEYLKKYNIASASFKVESKRSDKRYPKNSMQISADCGGYILDRFNNLHVDVHRPDFKVYIEIREKAYVYVDIVPGQGGMPLGSNGKGTIILSGGIDSPVAGYMISKRGVFLDAVHFESFPYTSERARQKVIKLAKIMSEYTGPIRMYIIHFTDIQLAIYEKCPEEQLTVIMRRFMMRIAERVAKEGKSQCLITGESIGQVASQTMEALNCTNSVVSLPVFRPLIGMDKQEIMDRAKAIDTYETSILPFEDCCTVFVPKHPSTRPTVEKMEESEKALDIDALINGAFEKSLVCNVTPDCDPESIEFMFYKDC